MNRILDVELILAARDNNLPEVSRLLSAGADVNVKNYNSETPLHWASYYGIVHVLKELVEHGADIEAETSYGCTPLHWACDNGHVAVVKKLLDHGANTEAKDIDGNTPLHSAAIMGHLPVVKAFLSGGAGILAANNNGELPIHKAVSNGHSAVSKYLLREFYATIRRLPLHELLKDLTWIGDPCSSDTPPLRFAFQENLLGTDDVVEILEYLVDRNPELLSSSDQDGSLPLHVACRRGASIGVPHSWDYPPLRKALHRNVLGTDDVVEILEYLIDRNPELLTSRDQDGSLPLHVACRRGASFAIVQSLVNRYKASVKSVTPQGDLPLFLACEMTEPSLDTIFILVKLYPDLVYR
jgi:ankyrin repeat protein